jgi:hypothetical protein
MATSDLRRACVRLDRNGPLGLAVVAPVRLAECVRHARGIGCGPVDPAAHGYVLEQACSAPTGTGTVAERLSGWIIPVAKGRNLIMSYRETAHEI